MSQFHIRLLGALQIEQDGKSETQFRSRRAIALLVYLISNNRPIARAELVEFIWPDKTEKQGRGNLRWALNYLSKTIPDALTTTRHTVQFDPPAECTVDVKVLAAAIAGNDTETLGTLLLDTQGSFMTGFYFDESAEFETWIITQRETWRLRILDALETQITHLASNNAYNMGLQLAEKWLAIEPWSEAAHRWTMQLYARIGRTDAALEQYERCWRILAEELGTEPTDETTSLFQRIQQVADQPRHNLPAQPTSFVGRQRELAAMLDFVRQPDVRLITVVGPGGMGKTRLAIETGDQLIGSFIDGVVFIDLTYVASAEDIPTAVLQGLTDSHIISPPRTDNTSQRALRQALGDKELLLILDNFEHVIEGTGQLVTLLKEAPKVQLLVTSRERLNVRWERLVEISGLPLDASRSLFVQSAKRARPAFKVTPANRRDVDNICQLVEGMPLAIELAAAWTRMQSCGDIAQTIQSDLDFLTTAHRDTPDRHRSVRAVFESSWRLLAPEEQEQLGKLALFAGGFSAESARTVTGASWASLAPLVDKSLISQSLSVSANGTRVRYQMHELLRQFSAEKLTETTARATHDSLTTHFCHFLHERDLLTQKGDPRALDEINSEIANIKQAWTHAVETQQISNLAIASTPLAYFFDMRSRWQESVQAFEALVNMVRPLAQDDPLALVTLGAATLSLGNSLTRAMRYREAEALLREGHQIVEKIDHAEGSIFALFVLARVRGHLGDNAEAKSLYEQSLTLATTHNDLVGMARAKVNLSGMSLEAGEWEHAKLLAEESKTLFTEFGDQRGVAVAALNIGHANFALGLTDEATDAIALGRALAEQIGAVSVIGNAMMAAARVAFCNGQAERASVLLHDALDLFSKIGDDLLVINVWHLQGRIAVRSGKLEIANQLMHRIMQLSDHLQHEAGHMLSLWLSAEIAHASNQPQTAKSHTEKALTLLRNKGERPMVLEILSLYAKTIAQDEPERAAAIDQFASGHPCTPAHLRQPSTATNITLNFTDLNSVLATL